MKFLLGSDPEAFIVNTATKQPVSSRRFTTGTKVNPEDMGGGYALLNDNILIEGNVPPAANKKEFVDNMTTLWDLMNARANQRLAHLENHDCMEISATVMETPEAKEFGCSAFRDAWNENIEIQTPSLNGNMRPAGCHIHIGLDNASESLKMAVVRAFDLFVTLPAIEISGMNYRTSNLYGILGACRIKEYGVEARSLGGKFFNPEYFEWIYEQTERAINYAYENEDALVGMPSITTYIGEQRINIVKEYKKLLNITE
jgi:hypothetical protein